MNKKLFAVLSTAGIAATFWACGSGEIYEPGVDDESVKISVTDPSAAIYLCDPYQIECTPLVDQSSAAEEVSSSSRAKSSSSIVRNELPTFFSSSSAFVIGGAESSAGGAPAAGVYGTCEPSAAIVDKVSGTVYYTFKPASASSSGHTTNEFITRATYKWDLGAGAVTKTAGTSKFTSDVVSYSASGLVTPAVTITFEGTAPQTISCGRVQVNGDPITGCKCTTAATSVDYTASPEVSWTVAGCTTASMPLSYSWEGGAAGATASFTKAFDGAQAGWAPKLMVGNSDNTVIPVECPNVKTTKGAEYIISEKEKLSETLPAGEVLVATQLPENWHNGETTGDCHLQCDAVDQTKSLAGTKVDGVAVVGVNGNNFQTTIDISKTINSSIVLFLPADSKCKIYW